MDFRDSLQYVMSSVGIGILGIGIVLSAAAVVFAFVWLLAIAPRMRGATIAARLTLALAALSVTGLYLRAAPFSGAAPWWKIVIVASLVLGFSVPALRIDAPVDPGRVYHRGMALMVAVWMSFLVLSQALLVAGDARQGVLLYLLAGSSGWLAGFSLGSAMGRMVRESVPVRGRETA
ncbi:MAG: hypothetical protein A2V83_07660 [Nitrospirae bacterium RBG_16_64_22]|nr:MAG: hypothetical protein A2V83_07660 [Nitrospirae bacterium RBG_16_64_22]